ncbi:MAG: hypothetical protein ABSG33_06515 [Candidatus Bathyarchaeia archaeon]|jgi:hypothetical protein
MKLVCPVCNNVGFLEERGQSFRVKHYLGFENGKRKYTLHKVTAEQVKLGINGNQNMGINNLESSSISRTKVDWGDLNPYASGDITRKSSFFIFITNIILKLY